MVARNFMHLNIEKKWVAYPHYAVLVFDVLILLAALRVWTEVKINQPQTDERVRIIAQQWAWTFVHPGPDGKLDTTDDIRTVNELNLQVNTLYHYELHSKDVLHSFSVPAFRLKQDAVPGMKQPVWFRATENGTYDLTALVPGTLPPRNAATSQNALERTEVQF